MGVVAFFFRTPDIVRWKTQLSPMKKNILNVFVVVPSLWEETHGFR